MTARDFGSSSRNGIGGHLNTQNGTKQSMSYYQHQVAQKREAHVLCDTGSHKLNSQKSTGAIHQKGRAERQAKYAQSQKEQYLGPRQIGVCALDLFQFGSRCPV